MYQKDYILRMIEMFAELLAGILGLIKKGDFKKAAHSIDNAYQDLLKQDAVFFNNIPLEKITDELIRKHNYTNGHLEILSGLFYTQAELLYAQNEFTESLAFYKKSLFLARFIMKESQTYSVELHSRISYLETRIEELENGNH